MTTTTTTKKKKQFTNLLRELLEVMFETQTQFVIAI